MVSSNYGGYNAVNRSNYPPLQGAPPQGDGGYGTDFPASTNDSFQMNGNPLTGGANNIDQQPVGGPPQAQETAANAPAANSSSSSSDNSGGIGGFFKGVFSSIAQSGVAAVIMNFLGNIF